MYFNLNYLLLKLLKHSLNLKNFCITVALMAKFNDNEEIKCTLMELHLKLKSNCFSLTFG